MDTLFPQPLGNRARPGLRLAPLLSLLVACGGSQGDDLSNELGRGTASLCEFDPLFEPQELGEEGDDLVRHIAVDSTHDDVVFSGYLELFQVGRQGGEPVKLGDLLGTLNGEFWLAGDKILVPGGVTLPEMENADPVLLAMPRAGGKLAPLVSVPEAKTLNERYDMRDIRVLGDDVYWVGVDMHTDDPSQLLPDYDTDYVLRSTSWKTKGTPHELYRSKFELSDLIVSSEQVVFSERNSQSDDDFSTTQKRLPRAGGEVRANDDLLGEVRASFGPHLLVERPDFFEPSHAGLFRMRADGGEAEAMVRGTGYLAGISTDENGFVAVYAPTSLGKHAPVRIYAMGFSGKAKQIGCIDAPGTIHGVGASRDTVYVALHDESAKRGENTILRFAR